MKKKASSGFIRTFAYLLRLFWQNQKLFLIAAVLVAGLAGLLTATDALFKQWFFEAVQAVSVGAATTRTALFYGVLMAAMLILSLLLSGASEVFQFNLGMKLSGYLGRRVNEKSAKIDPICFEDSTLLDDISKAYKGVEGSRDVFRVIVHNTMYYIPYFLFMGSYLFRIKPALCLCLLLVAAPTVINQLLSTRYYRGFEDESAPIRRQYEYYDRCITDREYARETRLLGAFWFFRNLYEIALLLFAKKKWQATRKSELQMIFMRLIGLAAYVGVIAILYNYLLDGTINVAIFAAVFTTIDQMFKYVDWIGYGLFDIAQATVSVYNTMRFLELPERSGKDVTLTGELLEVKNASFSYPNTNEDALSDINLTIHKGETIAIVGENGAGKSTLVKLLIGLYLPKSGDVLLDSHSTRDISPQSIYSGISAVFQKFQRYRMTLSENISISAADKDEQRTQQAAKKADLDPKQSDSFPEGYDTLLSREFGGTDLSGGQWQRVALARGFYRAHNMIILDEPTAAIDPIEETKLYKKFAELSKGKAAVIVTHRLGSAKIADRIVVMDSGRITATGTHESLMQENGLYARMFNAQAQWYENE